jgi:hypothetical protein
MASTSTRRQRARKAPDRYRAGPVHESPGAFLCDLVKALGVAGRRPDLVARRRIARSRLFEERLLADQKTVATPGLIPQPVVEPIVSLIDDNRPLTESLGGTKPLDTIAGATFTRPVVTGHTATGTQPAEKQLLASQAMTINPVTFTKNTFGGSLDVSFQDMNWTSPPVWDALLADLAAAYALGTEQAVATAFAAAATATVAMTGTDLKAWTLALYTAGMHSYQNCSKMPDRVWCSLDVWAALGSLVDTSRPPVTFDTTTLGGFKGDLLGQRIVCPTLPSATCIVGHSSLFEVYEETPGLISVVEPFLLGILLAYGGDLAYNAVAPAGLVRLSSLPPLPTM